jgi:hypothetical protein
MYLYITPQLSTSLYPSGGRGMLVSLAPPGRKLISLSSSSPKVEKVHLRKGGDSITFRPPHY